MRGTGKPDRNVRNHAAGRKRILFFAGLMFLAFAVLVSLFVFQKKEKSGNISRKEAGRRLALALTDQEQIDTYLEEHGSLFQEKSADNGENSGESADQRAEWYEGYLTYLAGSGYLEAGEDARVWADGAFTRGDAMKAAEKVSAGLAEEYHVYGKWAEETLSAEEWGNYYEKFLLAADPERNVKKTAFTVFGSRKEDVSLGQWEIATSLGILRCEGESVSDWTDRDVSALVRGNAVIGGGEILSDRIVYPNAWVARAEKDWKVFVGGIVRTFKKLPGIEVEDLGGQNGVIADISLEKGKPEDAVLKKETVEGRILSVGDSEIEIEGVGTIPMAENFHVYKTYGEMREEKTGDMLIGYDLGPVIVEKGEACAALIATDRIGDSIRVLIMTDDFSTIFHDMAVLRSEGGLTVTGEGISKSVPAGERFTVRLGDELLRRGRISVRPAEKGKEIELTSINRLQGKPTCRGTIELFSTSQGLLIINELKLEDYLKRVVPSEMPESFPLEALKAQAVTARTFACRQILNNVYSHYGAHVDDSVNCQVYNNIDETGKSNRAVEETAGIMLYDGDEPAQVYYFSTSCGYTTDMSAWGTEEQNPDCIAGRFVGAADPGKDMTKDENFTPFIMKKDGGSYDSSYPMYRWTAEFTGQWARKRITGIGTIYGFFVEKRAAGGSALKIRVVGSKGEKVIRGMMNIRRLLGDPARNYYPNGGGKISGIDILPSAFIHIDETSRTADGDRVFTVWGGGMGHGIGMSQNAAGAMAEKGKSFGEILQFFYNGAEVRKR